MRLKVFSRRLLVVTRQARIGWFRHRERLILRPGNHTERVVAELRRHAGGAHCLATRAGRERQPWNRPHPSSDRQPSTNDSIMGVVEGHSCSWPADLEAHHKHVVAVGQLEHIGVVIARRMRQVSTSLEGATP